MLEILMGDNRKVGPRMGDIGTEAPPVIFEPIETPEQEPTHIPSDPQKVPVPA